MIETESRIRYKAAMEGQTAREAKRYFRESNRGRVCDASSGVGGGRAS